MLASMFNASMHTYIYIYIYMYVQSRCENRNKELRKKIYICIITEFNVHVSSLDCDDPEERIFPRKFVFTSKR